MFYEKLLNDYFYNQNYDEETAKRYAYIAIRNIIGASIFMFCIVISVIFKCILNLHTDIKGNRPVAYVFMATFIFAYLSFTKKFLKPMFATIELKKDKPVRNYFFLICIILFSLFCGGMFVIARLLNFYLCR